MLTPMKSEPRELANCGGEDRVGREGLRLRTVDLESTVASFAKLLKSAIVSADPGVVSSPSRAAGWPG
jgi:hypothetical protein